MSGSDYDPLHDGASRHKLECEGWMLKKLIQCLFGRCLGEEDTLLGFPLKLRCACSVICLAARTRPLRLHHYAIGRIESVLLVLIIFELFKDDVLGVLIEIVFMTLDPRYPHVDQERLSCISLLFLALNTEDLAMPVEELDSILLFAFLQVDAQHGLSYGVRDGAHFGEEFLLLLV